ncbi:protein-L-isoaspartate O-methyltransferase [Pelomonas sp. APW6]|uniref:Protein-L-isoaspartate O-methyltransferase n=1 Tax=Roseateles subflavus TaxID=3053353 RepID=A0ABT7LLE0_9BURK|nr:protein-L-isoaspartate O-methyltransferase [Pelomonas sp. APW6]MDL5033279.1 protein-L-isoaspartate O-methyltransferase [Pelomonas sp. APW6]
MNFEQARFNMIEQQIRPWDVLDLSVLALLSSVRREDFVPAELRTLAFTDTELPLGGGRRALAPRVEARIAQELQLQRTDKVLEIGTGIGYLTALLGHKAQSVVSLEADAGLARAAAEKLRRAGLSNVQVREADGRQGAPGEAPFDAIVLAGSVAEVPQVLLDQLKVGGRLLGIVGDEPVMRAVLVRRVGEKEFQTTELFDTVVQRLAGFESRPAFAF